MSREGAERVYFQRKEMKTSALERKQMFERMEKMSSVLSNYLKSRKEFFNFWKEEKATDSKIAPKSGKKELRSTSKNNRRSISRNSDGTDSKRRSATLEDMEEDEEHTAQGTTIYQPKCIKNCILKDHQIEGLNWLIDIHKCNANGILADQMGLGKTVQTISILAYLREVEGIRRPHLIMCPLTVTQNWKNEFTKFFPECKVIIISAKMEDRDQHIQEYFQEVDY